MGYTIKIGEKTHMMDGRRTLVDVEEISLENQADFICGGDNNRIDLTYTDFHFFAQALNQEFINKFDSADSWLNISGCRGSLKITKKLITLFENAAKEYKEKKTIPSYPGSGKIGNVCFMGYKDEYQQKDYDWVADRLDWFLFWLKWAFKECKNPLLYFS